MLSPFSNECLKSTASSHPVVVSSPKFLLGEAVPKEVGKVTPAECMSLTVLSYQSKVNPSLLFRNLASTPKSRVVTVSQVSECGMAPGVPMVRTFSPLISQLELDGLIIL